MSELDQPVRRGRGRPRKNPLPASVEPVKVETDEEIDARLRERFGVLEEISQAATTNSIRSLIISGPAGLGKSFTVEKVLEKHDPENEFTKKVSGFSRATGVLRELYDYRFPENILVMDDCDSIYYDDVSLNLLKAALDSNKKRTISWLSEGELFDKDDNKIPRTFEYEGTCIFITNLDMYRMIDGGHKLAPHLQALTSRSMYLSLDIRTRREYLIRIRQVMNTTDILQENGYSPYIKDDVLKFIEDNLVTMRDLSLRAILKVAAFRTSNPNSWERLSRVILCK